MVTLAYRFKRWSRKFGKPIRRVYIEEGCMICNACVVACPEVFYLAPEEEADGNWQGTIVKGDAAAYYANKRMEIHEAAEDCCVAVIKIEYADGTKSKFGEEAPKPCCKSK